MYIKIPQDISLIVLGNAQTGEVIDVWEAHDPDAPKDAKPQEFEFYRGFLRRNILNDPSWGESMDGIFCAQELRGVFADKQPGDVVKLTKDQYDRLLKVVKNPRKGYNPAIFSVLVPYLRAIEGATDKDPQVDGKTEVQPSASA